MIKKLLKVVSVVLAVVLVITFFLNCAINVGPWFPQLCQLSWIPDEPLSQLSSLVISTTAFAALLTYISGQDKWDLEKKRDRSKFFFEQAKKGLDETYSLLSDRNNDRITWIRAARTLLQSISISQRIELDEYKEAYRLHAEKVRNDLYITLSDVDKEHGGRKSLPPQFFYGIANYAEVNTLDEAAKLSSSRVHDAVELTIDSVIPYPSSRQLEPSSVRAIYDFLEFPKNYDDPLDGVEEWKSAWRSVMGTKEGAARYVAHLNEVSVFDGKIIKKSES